MDWNVTVVTPKELSEVDLAACVEVIAQGDAVDPDSAAAELPHALRVAIARAETTIVGVMAIKRARPAYAVSVAKKSGFGFPSDLAELGYAAVREDYQGRGIGASLIVQALTNYGKRPLFATTSHPAMKKHLLRAGFGRFGKAWAGRHGELTLWILK